MLHNDDLSLRGSNSSPHLGNIHWPKPGAAPKRKVETVAEPEDNVISEQAAPIPPKEPLVKLYNLNWSVESAHFGEKVSISLFVDLPESLKEINRVIVTVFACPPNRKKEQVKSRDLYVQDGKVQGEFELLRPSSQDGKQVESCPYYFTAKHRDSKEMESPRLPVKGRPRGEDELVLEFNSSDDLKTGGLAFHLKSKDGSIDSKIEAKNGEEKDGKVTLKFTKLDSHLEYTLDMLNSEGKVVDTIFPETLFGKWTEEAK